MACGGENRRGRENTKNREEGERKNSHGAHLINIWNLLSSRGAMERRKNEQEEENMIISQQKFFLWLPQKVAYVYKHHFDICRHSFDYVLTMESVEKKSKTFFHAVWNCERNNKKKRHK